MRAMNLSILLSGLALTACLGGDKGDDTGELDANGDTQEDDSDTDDEVITPPDSSLSVDYVGAYGSLPVKNSVELGDPVVFSNGEQPGIFSIVLANEAWLSDQNAMENATDACWIQFDLGAATTVTLDPGFTTGDQWVGWTFSGAETFAQKTPSCDEVDSNYTGLIDQLSAADFGIGFGALDADLATSLSGSIGADWEADYAPYFLSQYVSLDFGDYGGETGWSATNYARAYQLEEDNTLSVTTNDDGDEINVLLDISEATYAPDGFYSGGLYYMWGLQ